MTHPIDRPRGDSGLAFGEQPAPVSFALPQGGCPGKLYAGRTAALCLRCAREPIGGPQIAPAWFRINGEPDCPNFVAHGCHVAPLPAPGLPPSSGQVPPHGRGESYAPLQPGVSLARSIRSLGDDT